MRNFIVAGIAAAILSPFAEANRIIELDASEMTFHQEVVVVSAGETVQFVVSNTGILAHEFVIGTVAEQEEHRKVMLAAQHQAHQGHGSRNGHHDHHDHHDGMPSITVDPGETKSIAWTAPTADDVRLEFACNIPGHYQAGMRGDIVIKDAIHHSS